MAKTKPRFSKLALIQDLNERADDLEAAHGFVPHTGWAQVEGAPTPVVVAYGRYETLLDLIDVIEDWSKS